MIAYADDNKQNETDRFEFGDMIELSTTAKGCIYSKASNANKLKITINTFVLAGCDDNIANTLMIVNYIMLKHSII